MDIRKLSDIEFADSLRGIADDCFASGKVGTAKGLREAARRIRNSNFLCTKCNCCTYVQVCEACGNPD